MGQPTNHVVATRCRGLNGDGVAFNAELFHATAESTGMEIKNFRCATRTFNDALRLLENLDDVRPFDVFQRGGRLLRM